MSGRWKLRGYVMDRLLGSGASGEVWRAHVAATGDVVALKRLPVRDPEQLRRAHAEAALLSVLDHPHLVRLHALVPDDDAAVLVLDLADGGSLAGLLAARGRLAPGEVITAIAPVAAALAYLHAEGVTHGDVSAANVLFTADGVPLLADLGVARLTGDDADAETTPAYIDPAVAAGCIPGPQSDVFMLAGVALHALTGAPPWPGATGSEALALARAGSLDAVADRLAEAAVQPAMAAVLVRALSADPNRRGTATDLALELRHSGEPVAVELSAGRARPEPIPWRGARHAALPLGPAGSTGPDAPDGPDAPGGAVSGSWRSEVEPSDGGESDRAAPPPTRAVKAPARPVLPRSGRRWVPSALLPVAAAAVVVAVVVATILWPSSGPGRQQSARDVAPSPAAAAHAWPIALNSLDATRSRAFATRNAGLLRNVYVDGPLLRADTALLTRLVPAGCGLHGARTRFSGVSARARGSTVRVTATATLSRSTLECTGRPTRRAAGAGPVLLHVTLTWTSAGLRISGQQVTPTT